MIYLLWCKVCTPDHTPDNTEQFDTVEQRGRWAQDHWDTTGHVDFTTYNLSPETAGAPE